MEIDKYSFGYPRQCNSCQASGTSIKLTVEPHFKKGPAFKVMLIGQDPTILKDPDKNRVKEVLMLDDEKGQLKRWLTNIFGEENFGKIELYATNLIKCTFDNPPSTKGGKEFLRPFFDNCKSHLLKEIQNYRPNLILTFGEPAHYYFLKIMPETKNIETKMNKAFKGDFYKIKFDDFVFDYSPCLHIKTFRVAETYGEKIKLFKTGVSKYFINKV